jgi:glycosyltransferase involved in cell wall biosynthesis
MRILIVMDPGIIVPPKGYGGHERLVYLFAKEYSRLGHEVHLLVTEGSVVEGCTVHSFGTEGFPPKKSDAQKAIIKAWKFLYKYRNEFDLIHNFGRLAYLLPVMNCPLYKIMTYGRKIDAKNIYWFNKFPIKNIVFTAPSDDCVSTGNVAGNWFTVHNAIDFSNYTLISNLSTDAPLIFLSRLEKVKGCHIAIEVAKATGNKLLIAGNISPLEEERVYFKKEIEPHIDGIQIQYVGAVNDEQKNEYLGMAKVMLFPIDVREAFGMVMIESMACGTPVIGFAKGAVPEVIQNGITGFVVSNKEQMIDKVNLIDSINRKICRESAQSRFDVKVVAQKYLSIVSS